MVTMSKEYAQEYYKKNKEYFKEKQTASQHLQQGSIQVELSKTL